MSTKSWATPPASSVARSVSRYWGSTLGFRKPWPGRNLTQKSAHRATVWRQEPLAWQELTQQAKHRATVWSQKPLAWQELTRQLVS